MENIILQAIAQAIEKSGKTRYEIAQDTGIDNAVLCRIVHGGSCGMKTAHILCEYLQLELKPVKGKAKR